MNKEEYQKYLQSEHWKEIKARFRQGRIRRACFVCGEKQRLDLHHKTYERLHREALTDLVLLCRPCHKLVHAAIDLYKAKGRSVTLEAAARVIRHKHNMDIKKEKLRREDPRKTLSKKRISINTAEPQHLPPVIKPNGRLAGINHGYKIVGVYKMRGSGASPA